MSKEENNSEIVDSCAQRLTALQANVPAKTEVVVDGVRYSRAQIAAIYQASLDTRAALVKSRAQVKVDLAARSKAEVSRLALEPGIKAWVMGQFGASSNVAHEFGYAAPKKGAKTAETVANAVKLAGATRKARHTMGSRQRKGVKGTLVVPAAPADPVNPNPTTLPASAAATTASDAQAAPAIVTGK